MIRVGVLLAGCAEVPEDDSWLDPEEAERARSFKVPGRRLDFRLGRWTAKHAIAAWLGGCDDLSKIAVRTSTEGAPRVLVHGEPAPLEVSFSHRDGRAACAVAPAGTRLGCDLEWVEPRSEAFVQDYFVPSEIELVRLSPVEYRPLFANLIWSAKESALKALKTGLREDTRSVEVRLLEGEEGGWNRLEVVRPASGETFHGWWRREAGWVLTVVADPEPKTPARLTRPEP
ncbi:MAG: 4'-phosphopantetheinyl transferase family protein [Thermoanaerobaculia bacterium]